VILRLLLPVLVLLTACTAPGSDPAPKSPTTPSEEVHAAPARAVTDVLVTGDISWARFMEDWAGGRTRWPFKHLDEFGTYDAFVGNLECPVVNSNETSDEQDTILSFHCEPEFLGPFSDFFTAVSLANNHTDNHGESGMASTRRHLGKYGIQYFGDPDPERLDRVCAPVMLPVRTDGDGDETGVLPVAMCGWNGVFQIPTQDSVDEITRWADHVPVLAFPHSGLEYVAEPDSIKVDLFRRMIDAGADAVLGSHPHWVQSSEVWHGRLIVYSLGNFIFDQQTESERTRSAAIHLRLSLTSKVPQWLEVGEQCAADPDNCLQIIEDSGLREMKARLEYDVVGSRNENRLTHPATAAETADIERRLDWADSMDQLRPPYGPLR